MARATSRLPPLPALRDFIHMYQLKAKKVLSQNYLMDMNLTRKIVKAAGSMRDAHVVEIGPGPGSITRAILESNCRRLDAIEIDQRFIPPLNYLQEASEDRLQILHGDALKVNIGELWQALEEPPLKYDWDEEELPPMHIIGNLPFNIASPLIIKYLRAMSERTEAWSFGRVPLTLTFQLEVARRICAPIDHEDRARISVMAQFVSEPKLEFVIPGRCFVPPPEIDVGVVTFEPRIRSLIPVRFEVVEKVVRQVFHYRNKYIIKGTKTLYPPELEEELAHEVLSRCRINPKTTSRKLGIEQFGDMAKIYEEQCNRIPGLFLYDHRTPHVTLEELKNYEKAVPRPYAFKGEDIPYQGITLRDSLRIVS